MVPVTNLVPLQKIHEKILTDLHCIKFAKLSASSVQSEFPGSQPPTYMHIITKSTWLPVT